MHSSPRNGAKVVWLAVHTTEGIMRATALRDWTSWPGSSHASSDETGALLTPQDGFVPYDRAAWTLRNGNPISENIEQCGFAKWTRAEWLARPKMLEATARWLADRSKARGIPLVRLSAADIKARRPGVLGHGDYSTATGDGTHWDPGPGYPWDVVLARAQQIKNGVITAPPAQEEDDMAGEGPAILAAVQDMQRKLSAGGDMGWRIGDAVNVLSSRDPMVNPISQAVADRKMVGNQTLWQWAQAQAAATANLNGQVAGLQTALQQATAGSGSPVDLDAVYKAAQDGARSIVDNLKVVAEPEVR